MKTTIALLTLFMTSLSFAAIAPSNQLTSKMPDPSEVKEGIDREEVRSVIKSVLPSIKDCYQDIREAQPNVEGKVVVRFLVDGNGKVTEIFLKSTEAKYPPLENCVMQIVKAQKFPKPETGSMAQVDYPFVFGYDKNTTVTSN